MLTETINKIRGALGDPQAPWYGSDVVTWVGDLIEDAEEQKAELEQHRWIPVSERLPKDGGLYLLTKDFDKGEDLWLDIFGSGSSGFKTIKEYIDLHHITHWKPIILPKP